MSTLPANTNITLFPKKDIKHYDELQSAEGRKIFYRPDRQRAKDLFTSGVPKLFLEETEVSLYDISITGLTIIVSPKNIDQYLVGMHYPVIMIFHDSILYEGIGRVVRHESMATGQIKVALYLTTLPINTQTLLNRYQQISLQHSQNSRKSARPDFVPESYKALCADTLHMARYYRNILSTDAHPHDALTRLETVLPTAISEWRDLWYQHNALIADLNPTGGHKDAIKSYTEQMITAEIIPYSEVLHRSYTKPWGYPGDFTTINHFYRDTLHGNTAYERYMDACALSCDAIKGRLIMATDKIGAIIAQYADQPETRILNVACGSANELGQLGAQGALHRNTSITLIDHDHKALDAAYKNILFNKNHASLPPTHIKCMQASFMELMRPDALLSAQQQHDIIYSLGLFDYFVEKRAKEVLQGLYNQLAPGGTLLISNLHASPISMYWPTEYLLDWHMIYRTYTDMEILGQHLNPASYQITPDSTNGVLFLQVVKPH